MEVVNVQGSRGPLQHLVCTAWKDGEGTYHILMDNPKSGAWIVVTLDVQSIIREAVSLN